MNLFKVEFYKLIKSKKYILFCLALIMLLLAQIYIIYRNAQNETPDIKLKYNEKLLVDYRAKVKDEELSKDIIKDYENKIKKIEQENKELIEEKNNPNYNWIEKLKKKNESLENERKNAEISLRLNEAEDINSQIMVNNYLINNNIMPHKLYEISAYNNMDSVISFVNIIFLPLLIVILTYDLVSGEMQFSTIKLLATKPVKRSRIILAKFFSAFIVAVVTVLILELMGFLFIAVFFKTGSPVYPISAVTEYTVDSLGKVSAAVNSSSLIYAYSYLIRLALLQVLFIFSSVSFTLVISTLFVNNTISLMVSSVVMLFLNIITFILPQAFLSRIYPYLFTTYVDGAGVVRRSINISLGTVNIGFTTGLFSTLLWGILFISLSCCNFINKDITA
ncbi:hypothetical protein HMPREF1982_02444 [Clostridiales bacterium oral taxon 876 str. F0540]|nr:hypothetical protein HMPREF1982_02444 [Clostridiales bacterium oral taxon 876 str. F0540]